MLEDNLYFLDWIAMVFAFLGVWMLGNQKRNGFIIFSISNIIWVAFGFVMDEGGIGVIAGNLIFLIINARGWLRWKATAST